MNTQWFFFKMIFCVTFKARAKCLGAVTHFIFFNDIICVFNVKIDFFIKNINLRNYKFISFELLVFLV